MNSIEALLSFSILSFLIIAITTIPPYTYNFDNYKYYLANDFYNLAVYYNVASIEDLEDLSYVCISYEEECSGELFTTNRFLYSPFRIERSLSVGSK